MPGGVNRLLPQVHPHTRGEYGLETNGGTMVLGSPPHAWGIRPVHGHGQHQRGGSPPHAWGIRNLTAISTWAKRFTPTRVGNTSSGMELSVHPAVHPHTRGEYLLPTYVNVGGVGSPPHAWGILPPLHPRPPLPRFTPTRVGNTPAGGGIQPARSVHPHTRGEYARWGGGYH